MGKWRKRTLWIAVSALAVMLLMAGVGLVLPDRVIHLHRSATSEKFLVLGSGSVGYVTVTDPTGYAIPYASRWQEVIDPSSYRVVSGDRVPLVYFTGEAVWNNRQGNPVTIRSWFAIYLLLAATAALVIVGNGLAWAGKYVRTAVIAAQALRRERLYSTAEHCPACGYDVRESADRCPECGQAFVRRTVILVAPGD
jgi:hypothetical protein